MCTKSFLKIALELCGLNVISYELTSGSNCVNPVIATYYLSQESEEERWKGYRRHVSARRFIFFQKDETSKDRNEKLSREEIEKCKKSLKQSKTKYRVLEEKVQDDGSIVIKVIKQYNNSPVGDYRNKTKK